MNLLEILKTNGTGLLEGLCRPVHEKSFKHLLDGNDDLEKAEISFSLGEKNLGTYECEIEDNNEENTSLSVTIHEGDDFVEIDIRIVGSLSFAKFEASLKH